MYIVLNKYTFRICIPLHVKKHYFIDFCGLFLNHQKPSVYLQGFHILFKHFLVVFHHKICVFIIFISFFDDVTNFRSAACDCMYAIVLVSTLILAANILNMAFVVNYENSSIVVFAHDQPRASYRFCSKNI